VEASALYDLNEEEKEEGGAGGGGISKGYVSR